MSVIKELYNEIITQLDTVTGIGTTGKWNSQVFNQPDEWVLDYPAAFVEINVEWEDIKQQPEPSTDKRRYQQSGDAIIGIHILSRSVDYSSNTFGDAMDIAKLIWDKLIGYEASECTPLIRINSVDDTDHNGVRDWVENYKCKVTECPNEQDLTDAAPVTITIDADYA